MMKTNKVAPGDLNALFMMHTGTIEPRYKHDIVLNHVYTPGVKDVAERLGVYWLIDLIFLRQEQAKGEQFQVWKVTAENNRASVSLSDGNNNEIWKKDVPYTEMPDGELTLWHIIDSIEDDAGNTKKVGTLLLPSEY